MRPRLDPIDLSFRSSSAHLSKQRHCKDVKPFVRELLLALVLAQMIPKITLSQQNLHFQLRALVLLDLKRSCDPCGHDLLITGGKRYTLQEDSEIIEEEIHTLICFLLFLQIHVIRQMKKILSETSLV